MMMPTGSEPASDELAESPHHLPAAVWASTMLPARPPGRQDQPRRGHVQHQPKQRRAQQHRRQHAELQRAGHVNRRQQHDRRQGDVGRKQHVHQGRRQGDQHDEISAAAPSGSSRPRCLAIAPVTSLQVVADCSAIVRAHPFGGRACPKRGTGSEPVRRFGACPLFGSSASRGLARVLPMGQAGGPAAGGASRKGTGTEPADRFGASPLSRRPCSPPIRVTSLHQRPAGGGGSASRLRFSSVPGGLPGGSSAGLGALCHHS